jgi:hypothetical protein
VKRIRNIHNLEEQQRLLEKRQLQLEKELKRDVNDIVQSVKVDTFSSLLYQTGASVVKKGLFSGVGLLSKHLLGKLTKAMFRS